MKELVSQSVIQNVSESALILPRINGLFIVKIGACANVPAYIFADKIKYRVTVQRNILQISERKFI